MTTGTTPIAKSRHWFRFKLRTLLILTAIVAVPLSWIAWRLEEVRQEQEAISLVETTGGYVYGLLWGDVFEFGASDSTKLASRSWWQETTEKWFGELTRGVVLSNVLSTQEINLMKLTELKHLEILDLTGIHVSNEQARELSKALPNCTIYINDWATKHQTSPPSP